MNKKTRLMSNINKHMHFFFTLPALLLYLFFVVYPMLIGFYYSFTDWNGISKKYKFVGFKNFITLFHDSRALSAIRNTMYYSILLVIIVTALSLLIACFLNSKIKFRGLIRSIYFFPAVLSSITVGLIFNEIFYRVVPLFGKVLGIKVLSDNLLSDPKRAIFAILLINIWQGLSVPIVMLLAGMQSIPTDLYEAASIDGANVFQKFRRITMPLLAPTISVVTILTLRNGLMVFDYIKATTNGGPGYATESIALLIYQHAFTDMRFSYSTTESLLVFLFISILAVIQFKIITKKEVF